MRKNAIQYADLKCDFCNKDFKRPLKEYRRNLANGKRTFCSRSCSVKIKNKEQPSSYFKNNPFKRQPSKLSPFKYIYHQVKSKAKKRSIEFNITVDDLVKLWESQNKKCPYTGYEMRLPQDSTNYKRRESSPYFASLDRIDSNQGYIQGNVEFVCTAVNYAKNIFSKEIMLDFFMGLHKLKTI